MTFKHLVRYVGASERWSAWGNPVLAIPLHPVRGHVCRHAYRHARRHVHQLVCTHAAAPQCWPLEYVHAFVLIAAQILTLFIINIHC